MNMLITALNYLFGCTLKCEKDVYCCLAWWLQYMIPTAWRQFDGVVVLSSLGETQKYRQTKSVRKILNNKYIAQGGGSLGAYAAQHLLIFYFLCFPLLLEVYLLMNCIHTLHMPTAKSFQGAKAIKKKELDTSARGLLAHMKSPAVAWRWQCCDTLADSQRSWRSDSISRDVPRGSVQ